VFILILPAHSALAYPSGRVRERSERRFLAVTYATVIAFPLAILLVHDEGVRLRYFDNYPRESLLEVSGQNGLAAFLGDAYTVVAYGALAALFIVLVARRLRRATPRARWILAPVLFGVLVAALWAVYNSVVAFSSGPPGFVAHNVFWWQIAGLIALPVALFFGLIRSRLAHADVGDLVLRLEKTPPGDIRDALAEALHDQPRSRFLAARTRRVRRRRRPGWTCHRTSLAVRPPASTTTTSRLLL
jgi:hypothetical protein